MWEFVLMSDCRLALFSFVMVLLLAACGDAPPPAEPGPTPRPFAAAFVPLKADDESRAIHAGALAAAREMERLNISASVEMIETVDGTPSTMAMAIEQIASTSGALRYDAIATIGVDDPNVNAAIDAANGEGIVVATFIHDAPQSRRAAYFGVNPKQSGRMLARMMRETIAEPGWFAVLAGNEGDAYEIEQIEGIRIELQTHGGARLADVVYCEGDPQLAWERIAGRQELTPQPQGWIWLGEWPLDGLQENAGVLNGSPVMMASLSTQAIEALEQGLVQGLAGRSAQSWGNEMVRLLDAIASGDKEFPEQNWLRPQAVTPETLERFRAREGR